MGYSPDWQKQNYAKGASTQKVTQKGTIVRNELFHNAPSRLNLADGGSVRTSVDDPSSPLYIDPETRKLKQEGLAASRRDEAERTKDMGAFDKFVDGWKQLGRRFTEGNIDSDKSEAYYKYGAGRGQMERDKVRDAKAVEDGKANAGPREGDPDQWASGRSWATSRAADEVKPEPVVEQKAPEVVAQPDPNSRDEARSEVSRPNNPNNAPQVSKSRPVDNGSSYTNPNNSNASISSDYSSSGNSSSNKSGANKNNKRRRNNNNNAAVKNASAAGTKYAEAFKEASNMPANATAEDRQRAAARVNAALENYKAQSRKIKPNKNK
jgi:hypothetical protein